MVQAVNLLLKVRHVHGKTPELFRVLERVGAAVGRVQALEAQVAAPLARRLPVAFDLAPFALLHTHKHDVGKTEQSYSMGTTSK